MSTASEATAARPSKRKRKVSEAEAATNRETTGEEGEKASGYSNKQACVACRQRKIRCNAEKPTCAYCLSKKQECVYGPPFKRAQCAQSHVDALEAKVRELEQANSSSSSRSRSRSHTRTQYSPTPLQDERGHHTLRTAEYSSTIRHPSQAARGIDAGQSSTPAKPGTHSSPQTPPSQGTRRRYGKSSSLHFALHLKASATAMTEGDGSGRDGSRNSSVSNLPPPGREAQSDSSHIDDGEDADDDDEDYLISNPGPYAPMSQLLPHRHLAKTLFAKYFEAIHPIWPFLLEAETRELFSHTWTSEEPPEPLWLVQLNLIMCLGCQHYGAEGNDHLVFDAIGSSKDFYHRAQEYVYANAFTATSIGMLQALLLMAQYQQGTMLFNEFYLTIGHAARMAQSLGLHISRPETDTVLPQHRELCRRLWWGCFCLDRISSMLYGRPMGIPYGEFSDYQDLLPRQVDDEYITRGQEQPADTPSVNSFFHHSVRLYHVMNDVLLRLRNAKTTAYFDIKNASSDVRISRPVSNINATISLLNTILQLDGHLLSWHEYLPPHLQFPLQSVGQPNPETPPWIQRQTYTLRSRFLGMRMLLHRQTILFLLQPPERRNWPQNGIQEWPPLFSDRNSDTLVGGSTPFRWQGVPSPVETTLTHLSASICVSSVVLQIEAIDRQSPSKFNGDWWWDLNATYNALCVLCGAMAFHRQDLVVVVTDLPQAQDIIRRGLKIIRRIATIGGLKAQQSEQFLRKLIRATQKRNDKDKSTDDILSLDHPSSVPINGPAKFIDPTSHSIPNVPPHQIPSLRYPQNSPNPSALSNPPHYRIFSAPEGKLHPAQAPTTNTHDPQPASVPDWNIFNPSIFSMGETGGLDQGKVVDPSSARDVSGDFELSESEDSIQTLFHSSFDIWGALGDQWEGTGGMEF